MKQICAFWDDEPEEDGWAKVTRMHHQPDKLDAATRATGLVVTLTKPPDAKTGRIVQLWVNPSLQSAEWRLVRDQAFRMPAADFLALLPASTRVQARAERATDPLIDDIFTMIEMMVQDNASLGIHPQGRGAREAILYLVQKGLLTQAQANAILD